MRTYVRVSQTQIHSALTFFFVNQIQTLVWTYFFNFIFRCSFYGTVVSELMLRTKGTFSCSMFTLSLTLSLTPVHNRTISTAVEQRWESTGFTMSVGRLAEPPKHSFLLPSEVSQSHTFMCNACKHMHQTQWHSRETRGRGEGGSGDEEWAAIKMGQSTQASQDNNSVQKNQYPTMTSAAGATVGWGGRGPRRRPRTTDLD